MKKIFLVGAGGHANSCIDVIESEKKYNIVGLVSNDKKNTTKYSIICNDKQIKEKLNKYNYAHIAIGQIKSSNIRKKFFNLLSKNFVLPVIKSPISYISKNSKIDIGTIIMHNAIINTNSVIGKNCIINSKALIEHDVTIGDHCHISTGSILNGNVKIGSNTFIGSGVILHNNITVGKNCIISAGKIIKSNVSNNTKIK